MDCVSLLWTPAYPLEEFDQLKLGLEENALLFRVFTAKSWRRGPRMVYHDPRLIFIGACAKSGYLETLKGHRKRGDFIRWRDAASGPLYFSLASVETAGKRRGEFVLARRRGTDGKLAKEWAFCLAYRLRPLCNRNVGVYSGPDLEITAHGDWDPLPSPIICRKPAKT